MRLRSQKRFNENDDRKTLGTTPGWNVVELVTAGGKLDDHTYSDTSTGNEPFLSAVKTTDSNIIEVNQEKSKGSEKNDKQDEKENVEEVKESNEEEIKKENKVLKMVKGGSKKENQERTEAKDVKNQRKENGEKEEKLFLEVEEKVEEVEERLEEMEEDGIEYRMKKMEKIDEGEERTADLEEEDKEEEEGIKAIDGEDEEEEEKEEEEKEEEEKEEEEILEQVEEDKEETEKEEQRSKDIEGIDKEEEEEEEERLEHFESKGTDKKKGKTGYEEEDEEEEQEEITLAARTENEDPEKKIQAHDLNRLDLPSLTKLVFKTLPFKLNMNDIREKKERKRKKVDPFDNSLDEIKISNDEKTDNAKRPHGLSSELKPELNIGNLYLDLPIGQTKLVKIVDKGNRSAEQLMKKSVLGPNLEKLETAPKVFESRHAAKKRKKMLRDETAGPGWYNLPKANLTDEVKRDIQLIKMRNVIDPHRHYKKDSSKELPKYAQIGTVIEGSAEFYSSRLTKKERKQTIVDQLLSDAAFRKRNKEKYLDLQRKRESGGKQYFKKLKNKRKPPALRT